MPACRYEWGKYWGIKMEGFEKARQQLDVFWRKKVYGLCIALSMVVTVTEVLYLVLGVQFKLLYIPNVGYYMIRFVCLPTVLNFFGICFTYFLIHIKGMQEQKKNEVVCWLAFWITSVIECTHYLFEETMFLSCVIIILSALLVHIKMCTKIYALSFLTLLCAVVFRYKEGMSEPFELVIDYFVAGLVITFTYHVARILAHHEEAQIKLLLMSKKKQSELMYQVRVEPTTGLYSRRMLMDKIRNKCKYFMNEDAMYLAMLDIDNFKSINDTYGHLCGDEVLKEIGKIISANIKNIADGFRYGGEEFVIIFEGNTMEAAVNVLENIRMEFESVRFRFLKEKQVTVSCGIAEYELGMTPEEWFGMADNSLYEAKHAGKNQVMVHLGAAG